MPIRNSSHSGSALPLWLLPVLMCLMWGCKATKHIPEGHYLLRSNTLKLQSDKSLTHRGELKDQLTSLIIQKPNTNLLGIPYKIWLYNGRYRRYQRDTSALNFQLKTRTVELPVIYDSALARRSSLNLKGYLFNQGYFYAKVKDTVHYRARKAYVTYDAQTGRKYLINNTVLDVDDSEVSRIIKENMGQSVLQKGIPYSNTLVEEERSRIANVLRNSGYFRFTQENIIFQLDTINKAFLRNVENPFESAIDFAAIQRQQEAKPTLDVILIIRRGDERGAYRRYKIGKVQIFPDFQDRNDLRDTALIQHVVGGVTFRYHNYYVREPVLLNHNFLEAGEYYTQDNYDRTITKMNELGLFQYVQLYIIEDTTLPEDQSLRCIILLSPTKKYDFSVNYEVSNGSTYTLGNDISFNYRNRNLFRGANQFTASVSGGIELGYSGTVGNNLFEHFYLLSRNAGLNTNISFPKFIGPFSAKRLSRYNQPRTIIGLGYNLLDRVEYFTLTNATANFSYNWKESETKTWDVSPAFVNVLRLPRVTDSFQHRLESNEFLFNSYRKNFIEGENVAFTFTNPNNRTARRQYSYVKVGLEEAGGVLTAASAIAKGLNTSINNDFSQYVKLDLDARHYFRRPHAALAVRLYGGVGLPYANSQTLPYVKQYFVGGPYSIRGWRVRQLGPGSYYDSATANNPIIDRTGDIKMEANVEYRFDMLQLFSGAIHLNGAVFADAGNIWLTHPSKDYPGGELALDKLGQDIAASTGAGLRVDVGDLFIIRLDAAFPVKKPYVFTNNGWVLDAVKPLSRDWRNQNIILNIAIGYPF